MSKELPDIIKKMRAQKSWSQALLAEASGLNIRTIQRLERNGSCAPETLLAVAGALDIDVKELTTSGNQRDSESLAELVVEKKSLVLRFRSWFTKKKESGSKLMSLAGGMLSLAPVSFILVNIIRYEIGFQSFPDPFESIRNISGLGEFFNITSPWFFFGSIILALFLNVFPLSNIEISLGKRNFCKVSYFGDWKNMLVLGATGLAFSIMLIYGLIENMILVLG